MRRLIPVFFVTIAILYSFTLEPGAQWVQTGGPEGGYISDLAMNEESLFAAISHYGVCRLRNSGETWEFVGPDLPEGTRLRDFFVSEGKLFALAVHDETYLSSLYLSADNGDSWRVVRDRLPHRETYQLESSGNFLFANTEDGPYISSDSGATWRAAKSGLPQTFLTGFVANDQCIAVGTDWKAEGGGCVYISRDNGISWENTSSGLPSNSSVNYLATDGPNLFAFIDEVVTGEWIEERGEKIFSLYEDALCENRALYRYSENSGRWEKANAGFPKYTYICCLIAKGQRLLAGTLENGVFRSSDVGANWTVSSLGLPKEAGISCLIERGSDIFAGTFRHGMFVSRDNGRNWIDANRGLIHTDVQALAASDSTLFVCAGQNEYISTDEGSTYREVNVGLPEVRVNCLVWFGSNLVAGTSQGIYMSENRGANWTALNSGLPEDSYVTCLAAGENDILAGIAGPRDRVFLSADNKADWIATPLPLVGWNPSVRSLLIVESKFFAGASEGIFMSADHGVSWTRLRGGFPARAYVQALAIWGADLYAGTRRYGVHRSRDGGVNWSKCDSGLPKETEILSLLPKDSDLYAVTDKGIYRLKEGEDLWRSVNSGLPQGLAVNCLTESGRYLYAGTDCGGVWKFPWSK